MLFVDDKKEVINLIINSCQKSSWISDAMKLSVGPIISALLAIGVFYIQSFVKKWLDRKKIEKDFKSELEYEKDELKLEIIKAINNFYSLFNFADAKIKNEYSKYSFDSFKNHVFLSLNDNYSEIYSIIDSNKKRHIKNLAGIYESLNELSEEFYGRIKSKWSNFEGRKNISIDFISREIEEQRQYIELCCIAINTMDMILSKEKKCDNNTSTEEICEKELEKINKTYDDLRKKERYLRRHIK